MTSYIQLSMTLVLTI